MKLTSITTRPLRAYDQKLLDFVDQYVVSMPEASVLAISSKVVSLCEGRVVKVGDVSKEALARAESQYYLPPEFNPYGVIITVKRDILIASAGIDESNGDGYYVLWPQDPQSSANIIREHMRKKFGYPVGVIITDSRITPMRRGTVGLGLAHSGFAGLRNYVGSKDIFGEYEYKYSYASIIDGLAAAAVVLMGEGAQRTPLILIEDVEFIAFQDRNPQKQELDELRITLEDDMYSEMLKMIPWDKRP